MTVEQNEQLVREFIEDNVPMVCAEYGCKVIHDYLNLVVDDRKYAVTMRCLITSLLDRLIKSSPSNQAAEQYIEECVTDAWTIDDDWELAPPTQ